MKTTDTNPEVERLIQVVKASVRGWYDLQKLRIMMSNRTVSNFKYKLGIQPGEKEDTKQAKKILKDLKESYDNIMEGVINFPTEKQFKRSGIISTYSEFVLTQQYMELRKQEETAYKNILPLVKDFKIWKDYLKHVKGIGHGFAGIFISEIDIATATYPSSIIKYCGLDVAEDGKARSKRKEHLIKVKYINKEGEEKEKNSITFNPFLKTKLLGVLPDSFRRSRSPYVGIYNNYKHRLQNHKEHKEKNKMHIHRMATRYMVKRFLIDLHMNWRELEGLPVSLPYEVAKLGYKMEHNIDTSIKPEQ